jgi:isochorismate hydrolase
MTAPAVNPTRTALINVDMQECFVEDSPLAAPDGPAVLEQTNRLAAACRAAGVLVVHTRGWMRPDRANVGAVTADLVPAFIVELYTAGTAAAELHHELVVDPPDVILDKPRYGAFHATELDLVLRQRGIDTVISPASPPASAARRPPAKSPSATSTCSSPTTPPARRTWPAFPLRPCTRPPARA